MFKLNNEKLLTKTEKGYIIIVEKEKARLQTVVPNKLVI